jgi:hypothetical protein
LTVSVTVPDDDEAARLFGVRLAKQNIQPVGLVIANETEEPFWFAPLALDPDYFTPVEAANRVKYRFSAAANEQMRQHFLDGAIGSYIPPGGEIRGFVFTTLNRGIKPVSVVLLARSRIEQFYFTIPVGNLQADYGGFDPTTLFRPEEIRDVGEAELRTALEALPCCAVTKDGRGVEDPLNFVLVGDPAEVFPSFARTGWHVTEVLKPRSALATFWSYFFGGEYKYAPVSPVYVFGRGQDLALQKARETARERNHLRIWLSPLRVEGRPVWVGQISRDIGLSFSWKTFVGHEVDPDVDEARNYLFQDMLRSQGLKRFAWVNGVGAAPRSQPHHMSDGSPFFSDGLRVVLWLSSEPTPFDEIERADWEVPPPR